MTDENWRSRAACKGQTDLFFYKDKETPTQRRSREQRAVEICRCCPVMLECRADGRANNEVGVWGGETDEDRFVAGYSQSGPYARLRQFKRKHVVRAAAKIEKQKEKEKEDSLRGSS